MSILSDIKKKSKIVNLGGVDIEITPLGNEVLPYLLELESIKDEISDLTKKKEDKTMTPEDKARYLEVEKRVLEINDFVLKETIKNAVPDATDKEIKSLSPKNYMDIMLAMKEVNQMDVNTDEQELIAKLKAGQ